jgi:hypothetical protein
VPGFLLPLAGKKLFDILRIAYIIHLSGKFLLYEQGKAMTNRNKPEPCVAVSVEADFAKGTWTFEPAKNFVVGAGAYAIQRVDEYRNDQILIGNLERDRVALMSALRAAVASQAHRPGEGPDWWNKANAVIVKIEISTIEPNRGGV